MKYKYDQLNFSVLQWALVSVRSLCLLSLIGGNFLFQSFLPLISSFIPFQIWKRYLACLINLIMNKMAFLVLGVYQFECQNFRFFSKFTSKITLKSGFIGIGTHKNILDFFYYSYLFNPVFVKLILVVERNHQQVQFIKEVHYAPLTYAEALQCALQNRGFDPIIARSEKQLKKIKFRKMAMKTLVSQCFEQLKGCIFILLPGLKNNEHVQIQEKIALDIHDNQTRFLRSGVGFKVKFDQRPIYQYKYENQIYFLLNLMSEVKINNLNITALAFRDYKSQYTKLTYRDFIEVNFYLNEKDLTFRKVSYLDYLDQLDRQDLEALQDQPAQIKKE